MPKLFKEIIFHAGMPKTGTSTIQNFLMKHRDYFEESYNLHYPVLTEDPRPFKENHSIFITSMFSKNGHRTPVNISAGLNTVEKLAEHNFRTINALMSSFKGTKATRLLLSAEGTSTIDRTGIGKLYEWLFSLSDNVKVVICLRHPLDGLSSEFQQKLKTGKHLGELFAKPKLNFVDKLLQVSEGNVGKEKLILYDFYDAKKSDEGVVNFFLRKIGIIKSPPIDIGLKVNTSMCMGAGILYSILNKYKPKFVNGEYGTGRFNKDLRYFLNLKGNKFVLPSDVVAKVRKEIKENEKWLIENYNLSLKHSYKPKSIETTLINTDLCRNVAKLLNIDHIQLNYHLLRYLESCINGSKLTDEKGVIVIAKTLSKVLCALEQKRIGKKLEGKNVLNYLDKVKLEREYLRLSN